MPNNKGVLVAQGKTKKLYTTDNDNQLLVEYIDNSVNYHGKKLVFFSGKGQYVNKVNSVIMHILEDAGISTHYIANVDSNCALVKRAEMIPIEVVVRNYTAGSMCHRLGLEPRQKLKSAVLEFCYKNDKLHDPVINEYHAYAMGLCSKEELAQMCYTAGRVNKILTETMKSIGIILADFKLEFGRVRGRLVIADEIAPTTARFWDIDIVDKLSNSPEEEYVILLDRMSKLQ